MKPEDVKPETCVIPTQKQISWHSRVAGGREGSLCLL